MKHINIFFFILLNLFFKINTSKDWSEDQLADKWNLLAKDTLDNILNRKINKNIAKNLILFIGDGMGLGTVTAGRIRKGQLKGLFLKKHSLLKKI